jgi:integrase
MGLSTRTNADGSSTYYFRFKRDGRIYTGSTGTGNKSLAAKFEDKKKRLVSEAILRGDTKQLTIDSAFKIYLDSQERAGQYKNISTRISKMLGGKLCSRTKQPLKVFGFNGGRAFDSLSNADVQMLVMERRKAGTSNGTILTELSTLSQVVKLIKKLGYIVPEISFSDIKKDSRIKPSRGKLRYLSIDEETKLLHQLNPNTNMRGIGSTQVQMQRQDAYDLAILLFDLGGRYNELASLEWSQIDGDNKQIHIYRSKVDNESVLYMTDRVVEVLARRWNNTSENQKYVFEAKDGTARKYSPRAFQSAIKRAGIENATIHTLRHTFASKLVQNGVSLQELQNLLGHATSSTSAIYGHLAPNQAAAKAASILNSL